MMMALLLTLGACLPVEGDRILARDLAAAVPAFSGLNGEEILGFTPAPGTQRRFSSGELGRLAARNGMTVQVEPVCFERKMEDLTKEQVTAALRQSLPANAELELIEFSRVRIPKGLLEFPRGGLTPAPSKSPRNPQIWRGRAKYGATQSAPVWARARIWISRPSVLAAEDLAAGKPIRASQIRIETVDAGPFSESGLASFDEIAGLALRRPIRAGQAIPRSALEAATDVTRGDMVNLEAHFGAALLRAEVRAEASGRIGDRIQVRNVESGKIFRAKVLRKDFVVVE